MGKPTLFAKLAAEFIGTFFLSFTVGNGTLGQSVMAALAIAASLMVAIYSLGSISGAHFNPAVTVAVYINGLLKGPGSAISMIEAALYIVVQLGSAILSSFVATWLWTTDLGGAVGPGVEGELARASGKLGSPDSFAQFPIFETEALYTMMLVFVNLNVAFCDDIRGTANHYFGLAIGFTIAVAASAEGNVSGTCLNPAVTLGIAATNAKRNMPQLPLYWGAQFTGTFLAVAFFYLCRFHIWNSKSGEPSWWSKMVAEFLGTFFLVYTVCLVVVQEKEAPVISIIGIASSLMCMIYALWKVSGGHFNPAVSFALLLTNHLSLKDFGLYILSQFIGGAVGIGLAQSIYPDWHVGLGVGSQSSAIHLAHGSTGAIACAEIFYTALLVSCVLHTAVRDAGNQYFGLVIGFSVIVGGVAVGSLSGGAFNPAVALSLHLGGLVKLKHPKPLFGFIYPLSEFAGAALAAAAYKVVTLQQKDDDWGSLSETADEEE